MAENNDKAILTVRLDHDPRVYNLSDEIPFQIIFEIYRAHDNDHVPRPLTLLKMGSVFDVPSALSQGILELLDFETGTKIDIPARAAPETPEVQQSLDFEDSLMTILPYNTAVSKSLRHIQHTFALPSPKSPAAWPLKAGQRYTLRLTSSDLGVRWWTYGTKEDLLAPCGNLKPLDPSEPARLCRVTGYNTSFSVVASLPHPPAFTVKLSLSAEVFDGANPQPIAIRITTTNLGDRPITAKNRFTQAHGDLERQPVTIISPLTPNLRNFSILNVAAGNELMASAGPVHVPSVGSKGYSRKEFTTLEPGIPFESEVVFLSEKSVEFLKRIPGNELHITLRPDEVWRTWDTMDILFDGQDRLTKGLGGYVPLLRLESSDKLILPLQG